MAVEGIYAACINSFTGSRNLNNRDVTIVLPNPAGLDIAATISLSAIVAGIDLDRREPGGATADQVCLLRRRRHADVEGAAGERRQQQPLCAEGPHGDVQADHVAGRCVGDRHAGRAVDAVVLDGTRLRPGPYRIDPRRRRPVRMSRPGGPTVRYC